jgi:hypothetical protein
MTAKKQGAKGKPAKKPAPKKGKGELTEREADSAAGGVTQTWTDGGKTFTDNWLEPK